MLINTCFVDIVLSALDDVPLLCGYIKHWILLLAVKSSTCVTIVICYSTWWKTWFFQSVFKRGELGYTFINLLSISWVLHWLGKARTDKTNRSVKTPAMLWCQVSGYVNAWGGYIRGANSRQSCYVIITSQLGAQNYTNVIKHNAYDIDQASSTYDMFIQ